MAAAFITRADARAQGLKRFFDGTACAEGHIAERLVSSRVCVECNRQRARANYKPHPKRTKSPAELKAYKSAWYQANKDRVRPARLARYADQRKDRVAYSKAWAEANVDKAREHSRIGRRNRRARAKAAGGTHTAADLTEILKAQGHRCAYCRADLRKTPKHVDHIVPLARGGSNGRANLQYLCQPCNQTKNSKDPVDFARSIGLLV